ncbi:hypothetical protein GCM10027191_03680 [Novilysobacter erysipheiresistens]
MPKTAGDPLKPASLLGFRLAPPKCRWYNNGQPHCSGILALQRGKVGRRPVVREGYFDSQNNAVQSAQGVQTNEQG